MNPETQHLSSFLRNEALKNLQVLCGWNNTAATFGMFHYEVAPESFWVVKRWADQRGGGGPYVLRSGISSQLEPRAEKKDLHPNLEISCDVILDSDWLKTRVTKYSILIDWRGLIGFSCLILVGCRQFPGYGHEPTVFGKV